ncbi:MAG TPA: hypothetical protein VLS85_13185 [Hanamia sp.]|nr:hypothetical protein [Hanamia sp.]
MKTTSINDIKKELANHEYKDLIEYCLRLAKFKKENKELLGFLLFEAHDLSAFITKGKQEIEEQFLDINKSNVYFIKKSVRKILRNLSKKIRISMSAQVEAELLIHFCNCIITYSIPIKDSRQLLNLYNNQLKKTEKALSALHPDLQYDLKRQMVL